MPGPAATGYKFDWVESGTGRKWVSAPPHFPASFNPATFTGLVAGHSYTIHITPFNAAGNGPTSTVTASTTGTGGTGSRAPMPYPAKAVAVYYMMWPNSNSPRLDHLPAGVNVVNLAFAQGSPPALVGWGPYGKKTFLAGIAALRARGVRVVLSVGGSGGKVNVANRTAFVNGIMAINAQVPLDGLDWDIEGSVPMNAADVVAVSAALKQRRGAKFAITMAPNGGNVTHYIAVATRLNKAGALDMIGQQFYDAPVTVGAADSRINQMLKAGIPQNKIAIGMMLGRDGKHWTLRQCIDNSRTLKSRHPTLRGGYLWHAGAAGTADWVAQVGPILQR